MPDWILTIAGWLGNEHARAIVIALIISWNGTQLVKNAPYIARTADDAERRLLVRILAFALGFWPAFVLWPGEKSEAVLVAIAVGLGSPAAYTLAARVLYHFFPWLEPKMSGAPMRVPLAETPAEAPAEQAQEPTL